jgi:hypothetical protein
MIYVWFNEHSYWFIFALTAILLIVTKIGNESNIKIANWIFGFFIAFTVLLKEDYTNSKNIHTEQETVTFRSKVDSSQHKIDSLNRIIERKTDTIKSLAADHYEDLKTKSENLVKRISSVTDSLELVSTKQKETLNNINGSAIPPKILISITPFGLKNTFRVSIINKDKLPIRRILITEQGSTYNESGDEFSPWFEHIIHDLAPNSSQEAYSNHFLKSEVNIGRGFYVTNPNYQYRIYVILHKEGIFTEVKSVMLFKNEKLIPLGNMISIENICSRNPGIWKPKTN